MRLPSGTTGTAEDLLDQVEEGLNFGELAAYREFLLRIDRLHGIPSEAVDGAKALTAEIERKAIALLKKATWLC